MKALDIYLHDILTKHTKLVKKDNEYLLNNVRVLITVPGREYVHVTFDNKQFHKVAKKEFFNALKFICFVKKTKEYLVRPVDCSFGLTILIYKSDWIIDKTLDLFKERVPFVRVPKTMTIYVGGQTQNEYKGGFIWSKLDSSQKPADTHDMNWGGFSGGYNPFNK